MNKPSKGSDLDPTSKATCTDPYGCTTDDSCYGAGCGLVVDAAATGAPACNCNYVLEGGEKVWKGRDDAWCQDPKNPFDDGYTCSCALPLPAPRRRHAMALRAPRCAA